MWSLEARRKQSERRKGNPRSEETKQKIREKRALQIITEETKQKISDALKGKKRPPRTKEHSTKIANAIRGRKHTTSELKKMRDAKRYTGEKASNWKGGISFEPYCPKFNDEFKERVRNFFGRKCVECQIIEEKLGKKLSVHHVNYDKMMCCNDVKPLFVALCNPCNSHANANRKYWEKHFTKIINEKYGGNCYLPCPTRTIKP